VVVRELALDLDAFEGPFDLLLTLVLREELEPAEVDVAAVVVAFLEELAGRNASRSRAASDGAGPEGTVPTGTGPEGTTPSAASGVGGAGLRPAGAGVGQGREELDLDTCGEFLVLVAALLELKARGLFPDEEAELSDLEPEEAAEELARRLAEYRRMKEAAHWLTERLELEGDRFFRLGPAPLAPRPERPLAPQDPAALAAALRALAADPPVPSVAHMALTFPPLERFLERFRALLRRRRVVHFDSEVAGLSRVEQAVAFLALLELRKANEVALAQAAPFAPIRVLRATEETAAADERRAGWIARSA
jgi:segregation and condensation protein A